MITSRLRPLDVKLVFEDHSYMLGETIELTVEMETTRDAEVREARVDLVCEERWTDVHTVMAPASLRPPASATGGGGVYMPPSVPKRLTKEYKATSVHSSVVFLQDARLPSGTTATYRANLEIVPEPPEHADKATVRWTLVTVVDIARARDFKARRKVKVTLT